MHYVPHEHDFACDMTVDPDSPPPRSLRGQQPAGIVETLRSEIISGQLTPNQPLRQEALAQRFDVSRMPVREALRDLDNQGFVVFSRNKGARVAPLLIQDMVEIFEMRAIAEAMAIEKAIPFLSNADIDHAESLAVELRTAPIQAFGHLNGAFHMRLYAPCARPRLLAHIDALGLAADRYLRATASGLNYRATSDAEHLTILRACRARATDQAVDAVTSHILNACGAMQRAMASV